LELERWLNATYPCQTGNPTSTINKMDKTQTAIAALVCLLILVATTGITSVIIFWQDAVAARKLPNVEPSMQMNSKKG
jgi:hypothetical protein